MKKQKNKELNFKELTAPYLEEAKKELLNYLSINSVYDESTRTEEKPFGDGVNNALDYLAKLGERLGFKVDRCDNYCTELSYGEGPLIDIYAHADVVPVSNSWKTDPFSPTIEGESVFARGATDDKGPGLASLYSAKALLDNKLISGYKLRLIFGGNEERGSLCLDHYFNSMHKEYPTYGFSPDADFPMIYAEKSIINLKLFAPNKSDKKLPSFFCGEATNIVIDNCEIKIEDPTKDFEEKLNEYRKEHPEITISYHNNTLHFIGKSVHGSTPWLGVNAGLHALNFLDKLGYRTGYLFDMLNSGTGEAFGGNYLSAIFDGSSYCVGFINCKEDHIEISINARVPENVEAKDVSKKVATAGDGPVQIVSYSPGFVVQPNSKIVKTLLKVYQEETGDLSSKPMAIGGGTYARESKNTIAFGPTFKGRDYRIHQDDEFILLDDFEKLLSIYAHAIYSLGKLCEEKE